MYLNNKSNQLFLSGFDKSHLSHTQQQDTPVIHTTARHTFHHHMTAPHINKQFRHIASGAKNYPGCFFCMWLVYEACQTSTSVWVVFN